MQVKNLDMKSTPIDLIKKISKSCLFKLFLLDLILIFLFMYYQPLCEPCIDGADCPSCLSKQQYFIIYFGLGINLLSGIYCLYRSRKNKH
jgi:uncharacterized membrane protein